MLYFLERRYRFGKVFGGHTRIVRIEVGKNIVALFIQKPRHFENFKPGMYLFLNIPLLSRFEWHPFTISSAPEDELLSLHIRCNGDWTNALYSILSAIQTRSLRDSTKEVEYPQVLVDGPVGAPSQDYNQYRVVMLIGAGIGVTPFASILKSIVNMWEENRCEKCSAVCHGRDFQILKIYFYWITPEQETLQWFADTMNQLSELDTNNRLEIHTYYSTIKRDSLVAPLELLQSFMHNQHGRDIISGLNTKNLTHFGRPNWAQILDSVAESHPNEEVGVFLCGPPKLDRAVSDVCVDFNLKQKRNVSFLYHSENF